MLETPGHVGSRTYHVAGIHVGSMDQESIVELVPLDQTRPAQGIKTMQFISVPLAMIEAGVDIGIFHHTSKDGVDS